MQNYSSIVSVTLAGFSTQTVPTDQEEEGKAQLCRQAGWTIHQQNANIGYLRKDSGNAVAGLTVDVLMDKSDGSAADMASSTPVGAPAGHVTITAPWSPYPVNTDPAWLARWVKPTAELANLPGPLSGGASPDPPEPPTPPPDLLATTNWLLSIIYQEVKTIRELLEKQG